MKTLRSFVHSAWAFVAANPMARKIARAFAYGFVGAVLLATPALSALPLSGVGLKAAEVILAGCVMGGVRAAEAAAKGELTTKQQALRAAAPVLPPVPPIEPAKEG